MTQEAKMKIPTITVNGTVLTQGQALTVRVAVINLIESMSTPDSLGTDEIGQQLRTGYITSARAVLSAMDGA